MNTRGFTLLEALIAGGLLAIGLTAIVQGVSTATDGIEHQKRIAQAIHVGEAVMEMNLVKNSSHADLVAGPHIGPEFDEDGRMAPGGAFSTSWNVTVGSPLPLMRTILVRVEWTERSGLRSLEFETVRR